MSQPGVSRRPTGGILFIVFLSLLWMSFTFPAPWGGQATAHDVDAGMTVPGGTIPPLLQARVTFVHAAPFATPPAATAVDVCDQAAQVVEGLNGIIFQQTETVFLDPGQYTWVVAKADSNCANTLVTLPVLDLPWSSHLLIVLTGDDVNYPIEAVVSTLEPGTGATQYFPLILFQE